MTKERLVQAAEEAARHAYAPYSGYSVGAAVLAESGKVYTGANVENVSFGLTVCAERAAIWAAVGSGERKLRALAVYTPNGAMPCGACRQVLREFAEPGALIYINREGGIDERSLQDLLPEAFTSTE